MVETAFWHARDHNRTFESSEPDASMFGSIELKSTLQHLFSCSLNLTISFPVIESHKATDPSYSDEASLF